MERKKNAKQKINDYISFKRDNKYILELSQKIYLYDINKGDNNNSSEKQFNCKDKELKTKIFQ